MPQDAKTRKAVERALMEEHRRLWMALDAAGAPTVNEDGVELLTVEARIEAMGETTVARLLREERNARFRAVVRAARELATVENGLLPAPKKSRR